MQILRQKAGKFALTIGLYWDFFYLCSALGSNT
jgi:hypothetical protein